jgi:phosphoserine phosphatase
MNDARAVTPHDVSPEAAIGAILNHSGPLLLDLDETLYLRNSTEDFIDSARPRLPALLLMRVLDLVKPWRWSGGEATRDLWRVRAISMCFPWTGRFWRGRVAELAARFANLRLLAALQAPGTAPIVTTAGFEPIVAPLVVALGLPHARLVSSRWTSFSDRRDGKLRLAVCALGEQTVHRALVLTDSAQDLSLLDACACPLRAVWPEARYAHALSGVYLPGQYLSRVKRPGERYIVRGILQEDFAFWVLASVALAAAPVTHVLGLLLLLASFWTIYECGYVDNDRIAAQFEAQPKLSAAFRDAPVATPRWQPWIWASAGGAAALFLLRWPARPVPADFLAWAAVLVATQIWFHIYNRLDKATRVWLFAGLQFARSAAFVAVVPIGAIGAVALGAHALAKWVPYCVYRVGDRNWPQAPVHLIRLLFFIVLTVLLVFSGGTALVASATAAALLAWNVFRARQEIAAAWCAARRLDKPMDGRQR